MSSSAIGFLSVFSAGSHREQFRHWQARPLFDIIRSTFPLRTAASSTLPMRMVSRRLSWHVTYPNGESFLLLAVARKSSCGPTRELILHRTKMTILCSERCGEVSSGTWSWKPESFFQSQQTGSVSHSHRGGWRRQETYKYNLNLLAKLMVLLRQLLFNLAITVIAEATPMPVSARQVPSLNRFASRYRVAPKTARLTGH